MPPRGLVEHFEEGFDPDLELFGIRLRVVRHDLEERQIQFLTHELLTDHDSTSYVWHPCQVRSTTASVWNASVSSRSAV